MAAPRPLNDDEFAVDVLAANEAGPRRGSASLAGGAAPLGSSARVVPPAPAPTRANMPVSTSMRMPTPAPAPVPNNTGSGGGGGGGRVPAPVPGAPATYRGQPINTAPATSSRFGQNKQALDGLDSDKPVDGNGNPITPQANYAQMDEMLANYLPVHESAAYNPLTDPNSALKQEHDGTSFTSEMSRLRRYDEDVLDTGNLGQGRDFTARGVGSAPTAPAAIEYDALNPYTMQQGTIDQRRGNDGWLEAKGALGLSMRDGRANQSDALNMFTDAAAGNGPSVAGDMVRANAQTAYTDTELAALRSGRMMGDANTRATSTYQQTAADQAFAARQANEAAQSNIMQGNEQALLAQAALAAGARGGGMGAAMRSAQNNTATQTQANIVQASAAQQAAQRDADFIAANAQREAFAQQGFTNVAAGDAFAQAALQAQDIRAQSDIEAARIRSGEQLHAMDMSADLATNIRGQDLSAVGAATDISRAGGELDRDIAAAQQADVDRRLSVEQMNRDYGLQADLANRDTTLAANELGLEYGLANQQGAQYADQLNMTDDYQRDIANQQNRQNNVGNEFGAETFYGQMAHDAVMTDAQMGAGAAQLDLQSDAAARDRLLGRYGISAGVDVARSGQQIGLDAAWLSAGATALAATAPYIVPRLSDERVKKDIDVEDDDLDVPDFRAAQNHSYRYKDPMHAAMRGKDPEDYCWGPMAQELPDHAIQEDDEGNLTVPTGELELQLAPAVGNAQRRLDDVEELLRTLLDADLSQVKYEPRKKHNSAEDEPEEDPEEEDYDLAADEYEDDEFDVDDEDPDDFDLEALEEDDEEEEPRKKKPKKPLTKHDKGMADLAIMLLGPPPGKKSKSKSKHSHSYGGGY